VNPREIVQKFFHLAHEYLESTAATAEIEIPLNRMAHIATFGRRKKRFRHIRFSNR
jgi:hypothetical protein